MFAFFSVNPSKDITESIHHDGTDRNYIIHLPKNYESSKKYPLIIALHGGSTTAKKINRGTRNRFNTLSDKENFIIVYPQGIKKSWNDNNTRDQNGGARKLNIDDVGFIKKMISKLENNYSVNSNHIFACGISNGGLMSLTLATELPNKIKAIGMVASNFSDAQIKKTKTINPFSLLIIHGTDDPIFPYQPRGNKGF